MYDEFFVALLMGVTDIRYVTRFRLVICYRRFGEVCYLSLKG